MRIASNYLFLFLFTLILVPLAASAQTGFSVQSDGDDQLYMIDLQTGNAEAIGPTGFGDIECLAFDFTGTLFAVDDSTDQLLTCSTTTGGCNVVGPLNVSFNNCGLTFDCRGNLFLSEDSDPQTFYSVNPNTGQATEIGLQGPDQEVTALAARSGDQTCPSGVFGLGVSNPDAALGCMDTATGAFQLIGSLINVDVDCGGIAFDSNGVLWGIEDDNGTIFTINPETGEATVVSDTLSDFEGLAIGPPSCEFAKPIPTLSEWGLIVMAAILGIAGLLFARIRRRKAAA